MEDFAFLAALGLLVVSGIECGVSMAISPPCKRLYWKIVGISHLPTLGALFSALDPRMGVSGAMLGFLVALPTHLFIRRDACKEIGPVGLIYTALNTPVALFLSIVTGELHG
jgi:hypothetical protein